MNELEELFNQRDNLSDQIKENEKKIKEQILLIYPEIKKYDYYLDIGYSIRRCTIKLDNIQLECSIYGSSLETKGCPTNMNNMTEEDVVAFFKKSKKAKEFLESIKDEIMKLIKG